MGWNFRKSIKVGPARINLSKSGVGYSVGAGGVRYTKRAGGKKKKTTLLGAIGSLFGICLILCLIMAVAAFIWTFILRFRWIFLAIGIAAAAGTVAYFVIKHRKNQQPVEQE